MNVRRDEIYSPFSDLAEVLMKHVDLEKEEEMALDRSGQVCRDL